jgi:hypothetical protein
MEIWWDDRLVSTVQFEKLIVKGCSLWIVVVLGFLFGVFEDYQCILAAAVVCSPVAAHKDLV